jgi:hypothetical protein
MAEMTVTGYPPDGYWAWGSQVSKVPLTVWLVKENEGFPGEFKHQSKEWEIEKSQAGR